MEEKPAYLLNWFEFVFILIPIYSFQLLSKTPDAKLGVFASKDAAGRLSEADAFFEPIQEYYFERSPIIFEYIVDYYVTGTGCPLF